MRHWTLIIFLLLFKTSFGLSSKKSDSIPKKSRFLKSENQISINSTHLPLSFFKKVYLGGMIDEKDKGVTNNIKKNNTSGFELDFHLGYKTINNLKNKGWYVSLQSLSTAGAKYSQGLFNMVFVGNKSISESINLESTSFHYRNHQIIHFGFIKKHWSFGISVGNILNEYQGGFGTDDQILFKSPYLWEINMHPNLLILDNNSSIIKNGNSFGFDLDYSKDIDQSSKSKFSYSIGLNNIGLMSLHNNLKKYSSDTSFNYEGLNINQIMNFDSTISDFINQIEPSIENQSEIQITPFIAYGEVIYHINNIQLFTGLFYRHNSQYIPRLNMGIEKKINNKFNLGTSISYGGYNKFQWGANMKYYFNNLDFQINIINIFGFIPSIGKSFGINLKIQWRID